MIKEKNTRFDKTTIILSIVSVILIILLLIIVVDVVFQLNDANNSKKTTDNLYDLPKQGAKISINVVRPDNITNNSNDFSFLKNNSLGGM